MSATMQEKPSFSYISEALLNKRQKLLIKFCELAGLEPYSQTEPLAIELKQFCQLLMDYSALCHFELFEGIINDPETSDAVNQAVNQSYPRIKIITNKAVDFNDNYAELENIQINRLSSDLSKLGEELAVCFEIEDRLLAML